MENQTGVARVLELRGNLQIETIESAQLAGNALRDPVCRPCAVYTPPGYDAGASRRYPVLYALHGYTGNVASLLSARPWQPNVVQRADRLIAQATMEPAIVVLVDGFTRLGGSQYVDSVHNGNYAQYVVNEVVPMVDARYRTVADAAGRGVFGKSSGGFGALHLVMEHPGVFGAVASHSGDAHFPIAHPPGLVLLHRTLESFDWEIERFVEAFESANKRSTAWYATMEMLGYAAAYSPRSARAFDLDLPVDRATGAVDEGIFERWLAFDPVRRCLDRRAELAGLRLRYIDCGRCDEYALDVGARLLAQRMREMGLAVAHEEFEDDHRNIGYRYDVSLPRLAAALECER